MFFAAGAFPAAIFLSILQKKKKAGMLFLCIPAF